MLTSGVYARNHILELIEVNSGHMYLILIFILASCGVSKKTSDAYQTQHELPVIIEDGDFNKGLIDPDLLSRLTLYKTDHLRWDEGLVSKGYVSQRDLETLNPIILQQRPAIIGEIKDHIGKDHFFSRFFPVPSQRPQVYSPEDILISPAGDVAVGLHRSKKIYVDSQKDVTLKLAYDPLNSIYLAHKNKLSTILEQKIYYHIWKNDFPGVVRINNVVNLKEKDELKRQVYMEYYSTDLQAMITSGQLKNIDPEDKIRLVFKLVTGLKNLHFITLTQSYPQYALTNYQYQFFHSDIKPSNIFCNVKKQVECVIGDFDYSAMLNNIVGTVGHYAPEELELLHKIRHLGHHGILAEGLESFNGSQDIWALGLTISMVLMDRPSLSIHPVFPNFNFIAQSLHLKEEGQESRYYQSFDDSLDWEDIKGEIENKKLQVTLQEEKANFLKAWDIVGEMLHPDYEERINIQDAYKKFKELLPST